MKSKKNEKNTGQEGLPRVHQESFNSVRNKWGHQRITPFQVTSLVPVSALCIVFTDSTHCKCFPWNSLFPYSEKWLGLLYFDLKITFHCISVLNAVVQYFPLRGGEKGQFITSKKEIMSTLHKLKSFSSKGWILKHQQNSYDKKNTCFTLAWVISLFAHEIF